MLNTTKDIFRLTDPELQELVGSYHDLYKVRMLIMKEGIVGADGRLDEDKFSKGFSKLDEGLTEDQGNEIAQSINSFIE